MSEEKKGNTIKELMAALGTPQNPVGVAEYRTFWASLSEEERAYYKHAEL